MCQSRSTLSVSAAAQVSGRRATEVPRPKPFAGFSRLGHPSKLSMVPQKAEPLAGNSSNPAPERPAGRPGDSP
jgi:hypothetical protein